MILKQNISNVIPSQQGYYYEFYPINASIKVSSPFSHGPEYPAYNTFQIMHDCNALYQVTDTELIYAEGEFEINQSSVLRLELYNFLVKSEVIFDLVPFRSSEKVPSLYL